MQDQIISTENLNLWNLPIDILFIILEKMDLVNAVNTENTLLLINKALYEKLQSGLIIKKIKKKTYLSVQESLTNFMFNMPNSMEGFTQSNQDGDFLFKLMRPLIDYFNSLNSSYTGNKLAKEAVHQIIQTIKPKFTKFLITLSKIRLTQNEEKLKRAQQNVVKLFKKYHPDKAQDFEAQNIPLKNWLPQILSIPESRFIEAKFPFEPHQWKKLLTPLMDTTKCIEQPTETFFKFIENLLSLPLETYLCRPEKTWYLFNKIKKAWDETLSQNIGNFLLTLIIHKKTTEDNTNSVIGRVFKKYDNNIFSKRYGLTNAFKVLGLFMFTYGLLRIFSAAFADPNQILPSISILLVSAVCFSFSYFENTYVTSDELILLNLFKPLENALPDIQPFEIIPSMPKASGLNFPFFNKPNSIQLKVLNDTHESESDDVPSEMDSSQEANDIYSPGI